MFGDDAPAMDAPAFLIAGMSTAAPGARPSLTIGQQPSATVVLVEIAVKALE